MIDSDKRKAVFLLHQEGMSIREVSKRLSLSRKAIRQIITDQGKATPFKRKQNTAIDPTLAAKLYIDCQGYVYRMHEKLTEEHGIEIGYSTLTSLVRKMELSDEEKKKNRRDAKVPDVAGEEMQHDTSPYEIEIGQPNGPKRKMKIVGSSLYLRYSKMRYLKFYPSFNRFRMKCFVYEAMMHFGYCAKTCIIDNTNLAVLHGTGKNAVMVPEMVAFAKHIGDFIWQAHELKHSDRKGGVESGFWFVETNFFPGRNFESLEDLNVQAMDWATRRIPMRPHSKTKLIPAQLFEFEKAYLNKLPPYVSAPVMAHERETDQYGYAAFNGNYYWIPGTGRGKVQILEYSDKIRIMRNREQLAEYALPAYGLKSERYRPQGMPSVPYLPRNCKKPAQAETSRLQAIDPVVGKYLEFVLNLAASSNKKHRLVRQLFNLSLKLAPILFIQTIGRAHRYRVTDIDTIEKTAVYLMRQNTFQMEMDFVPDLDEELIGREAYREGKDTSLPDLSKYDSFLENENDSENKNKNNDDIEDNDSSESNQES